MKLSVLMAAMMMTGGLPRAEAMVRHHPLLIPVTENEWLSQPQGKSKAKTAGTTNDAAGSTSRAADTAKPAAPMAMAAPAATATAKVAAPSAAKIAEQHIRAIDLATKGDTKSALEILKALAAAPMSPDEHDRVMLTTGRVKYQSGDYAGAVEAYQAVHRGSPSWLEALEERAGSQIRLGQTQEALGTLKTVLTPLFKDQILSEPYFLAALAQLRVCDYKSVFKTIDLFKTRFRDHVKEWDLAKADAGAQARLREVRETIQKLNLVEAEAIQHLYIDESGKRQAGSPPKIGRESDQLTFPMDAEMESKEVWLDEVDDYRVTLKGCPQAPVESAPTTSTSSTSSTTTAKKERTL